jgi:hypothetical protein
MEKFSPELVASAGIWAWQNTRRILEDVLKKGCYPPTPYTLFQKVKEIFFSPTTPGGWCNYESVSKGAEFSIKMNS